MKPEDTLLEFPCSFPVKIMGENTEAFESAVLEIFAAHCGDLPEDAIVRRESRASNYLALTITIVAESREQLDNIYRALSSHELVKMAL